jgi:hypothetical protein
MSRPDWDEEGSGLMRHAKHELRLAGMYDADCDYGPGVIAEHVLALMRVFAAGGHSGGSAWLARSLFNKLAAYEPLSALTSSPDEWMVIQDPGSPSEPTGLWQNRRKGSCFSRDGGHSYYDIDEEGQPSHASEVAK